MLVLPQFAVSLVAPLPQVRASRVQHRDSAVAGMDEAGVGAIAGPIVAAAVVLGGNNDDDGKVAKYAMDSKSLPRAERRRARHALDAVDGLVWACGAVDAPNVDVLGSREATDMAMRLAAARLERKLQRGDTSSTPPAVHYLIDGESVPSGIDGTSVVRGDASELAIAAASIFATVAHEDAMIALARREALWDFEVNLGWPSKEHLQRVVEHGPSQSHRASCFPFSRRHGRRLAFHPQRRIYARVQEDLQRAATRPREEGIAAGGGGDDMGQPRSSRRRRSPVCVGVTAQTQRAAPRALPRVCFSRAGHRSRASTTTRRQLLGADAGGGAPP